MAILSNGILGAALGKIGPVTGYQRNGRNILRPSRNSGIVKPTPARLEQRQKMTICNDFTRAFSGTGFFNKTFPAYGHTGSGHNRVTSSLLHLAITGTYPDQELSWKHVLIAKGPLPKADSAGAVSDTSGNIHFSWIDNSGDGSARSTDNVIAVTYCPELQQAVFTLNGGSREDGYCILPALHFRGFTVATWLSFKNEVGDVADSVFGGMVEV